MFWFLIFRIGFNFGKKMWWMILVGILDRLPWIETDWVVSYNYVILDVVDNCGLMVFMTMDFWGRFRVILIG
jgi:hypothetical protein